MSWHISGTVHGEQRWVAWDHARSADPVSTIEWETVADHGGTVAVTPTGPLIKVSNPDDANLLYLWALNTFGDVKVTGDPPQVQPPPTMPDLPEGHTIAF